MPDRAAGAASATQISPSVVARASGALRYLLTGKPNDFFGPGQPLTPVAQQAAGRQLDFTPATNLDITPRAGEPVTFTQLRQLADAYDLVRLAIETRKDQMAKLTWQLARRDDKDTGQKAKTITTFLGSPDKDHRWKEWLRMLLEDLFVIDAPCVYPRRTKGGELYALELVDGATIKRVIDAGGRTPVPPQPAYQQILKGLPAADFTRDELVYVPRNPRTSRLYGFSPVEQIITIINIALRRQLHQLNYYTDGTIPDGLASTPESWQPDQIEKFQKNFDLVMSGQSAQRRKLIFIPDATKYIPTKTEKLFDEGDEWLARVVCYCFNLPPTAFTKQVNRATAGTAQEVALEEGLAPIMMWVKDLMDRILEDYFDAPELEFTWEVAPSVDPLVQAQIDQIYVNAGVQTPDEVRDALGLDPLPDGQGEKVKQPPPPMPFGAHPGAVPPGAPGEHAPPGGAPKPPANGHEDGVTAAAAEKRGDVKDATDEVAKAARRARRRRRPAY